MSVVLSIALSPSLDWWRSQEGGGDDCGAVCVVFLKKNGMAMLCGRWFCRCWVAAAAERVWVWMEIELPPFLCCEWGWVFVVCGRLQKMATGHGLWREGRELAMGIEAADWLWIAIG